MNSHFKPVCVWLIALAVFGANNPAYATGTQGIGLSEAYVNRLADAIYKAEGGAKTRHPYGILAKYKHTTPRQACINTIRSKWKAWQAARAKGDYLAYLGSKYAPVGAANDPTGLNRNWVKNVRYHMGEP